MAHVCTLKPITVLFLFELEQCVEYVLYELSQYTHGISKKFEYFVSFLRQNCTNKSYKYFVQNL